jgi:hypothetical protein
MLMATKFVIIFPIPTPATIALLFSVPMNIRLVISLDFLVIPKRVDGTASLKISLACSSKVSDFLFAKLFVDELDSAGNKLTFAEDFLLLTLSYCIFLKI